MGSWGMLLTLTTIKGNLVNSGTITNPLGFGINLSYTDISGDLINTGTISAPGQVALMIEGSTVAGKIINTGTISGRQAISINNGSNPPLIIDNSGTLDGEVLLEKDILNLNGNNAHVTGVVIGSDATVNVNGNFTAQNGFPARCQPG
jgi:hypothetical protein